MLETEYVKSMNCNYERILLEEKPEEKRYQYCILSRGGITGLLSFSLRYINGDTFLYYDISSKQSMTQMFYNKSINREWIKDFVWNLNRMQRELSRFLLDERNLIWFPEQVYQDLDDNRWCFLYYPYYEADNGFMRFMEFIVSKIDHEDEILVSCVYKMYEEYRRYGEAYLVDKIRQDVLMLDLDKDETEEKDETSKNAKHSPQKYKYDSDIREFINKDDQDNHSFENSGEVNSNSQSNNIEKNDTDSITKGKKKKGFLSFLDSSKKKDREIRERAEENNIYLMDETATSMVAEKDNDYYADEECESKDDQDYGKTVYIEAVAESKDLTRRLYAADGTVIAILAEHPIVIGKKKDEADVVIDNSTISRVHARIAYEEGSYMLEDLNSTNGTFKNGLRLRPYERRKLMEGDEIKLGNINIMYK